LYANFGSLIYVVAVVGLLWVVPYIQRMTVKGWQCSCASGCARMAIC